MLIVEDGTGLEDANSYFAIADADAYCGLRGLTAWAGLSADVKIAKAIEASQFVDSAYKSPGTRLSKRQGLIWPGYYPDVDGDWQVGLPTQVVQSAILLAVEAAAGPLAPSATGPSVKRQRVRVEGVVETEMEYAGGGQIEARGFPAVDRLLSQVGAVPYLRGGPGTGRMQRA